MKNYVLPLHYLALIFFFLVSKSFPAPQSQFRWKTWIPQIIFLKMNFVIFRDFAVKRNSAGCEIICLCYNIMHVHLLFSNVNSACIWYSQEDVSKDMWGFLIFFCTRDKLLCILMCILSPKVDNWYSCHITSGSLLSLLVHVNYIS